MPEETETTTTAEAPDSAATQAAEAPTSTETTPSTSVTEAAAEAGLPKSVLETVDGDATSVAIPDSYTFEHPEAGDLPDAMKTHLSEAWKRDKLSQDSANSELGRLAELENFVVNQQTEQVRTWMTEHQQSAQYSEEIAVMAAGMNKFLNSEQQQLVKARGDDWNPSMRSFWLSLGKMATNHRVVSGTDAPAPSRHPYAKSLAQIKESGNDPSGISME